jgi:chorismate-pyruvate lyase
MPDPLRPKNPAPRALVTRTIAARFATSLPAIIAGIHASAADSHHVWNDSYQARLEILALIETLNADLLASRSATDTLAAWCGAHHMAREPKITARLEREIEKPLTSAQRHDLEIGPTEPVVYRRVELACGEHILSQADNWYVPSRLTAAMNKALLSSDTPFGWVVRPLHPRRQTIAVILLWHPLASGWEMQPAPPTDRSHSLAIPPLLFEHRAIVYGQDGRPISEVDESYRAELLDFSRD